MSRGCCDLIPLQIIDLPSLATEIEGTFRVNGSNKRMRELQAIFETPPRVRVCFHHTPAPLHSSLLRYSTASHSTGKPRATPHMTSRASSAATSLICLYVTRRPHCFYDLTARCRSP